jgi:cell division protein ZapD
MYQVVSVKPEKSSGSEGQMSLVIYEHPLNEKLRTFMRVEHLFAQVDGCKSLEHDFQFMAFFDALFALIDLLERNDLRSELAKELERSENNLVQWAQHPQICNEALQETLKKVVNLQSALSKKPKVSNQLKDDPFLSGIKQRFAIPGGNCNFDLPQLHFWRHFEQAVKEQQINTWLEHLATTRQAISLILAFVRERSNFATIKAPKGFYQDNTENLEMLRIKYTPAYGAYPTVSGNKYRYAIRFMRLCDEVGKTNVEEDIMFSLSRC